MELEVKEAKKWSKKCVLSDLICYFSLSSFNKTSNATQKSACEWIIILKMIIDFVSGLYLTLTRKEVEEINVICGQIAATFEH